MADEGDAEPRVRTWENSGLPTGEFWLSSAPVLRPPGDGVLRLPQFATIPRFGSPESRRRRPAPFSPLPRPGPPRTEGSPRLPAKRPGAATTLAAELFAKSSVGESLRCWISTASDPNATDGAVHGIDPLELEEWYESLEDVIHRYGPERVQQLLVNLRERAYLRGVMIPFTATTPYINTIPASKSSRGIPAISRSNAGSRASSAGTPWRW